MKSTARLLRSRTWFIVFSFFVFAIAAPFPLRAQVESFAVKDRVQTNVNGLGWIAGTIVEIGKGDQEGKVKVHADDYPNDFWVRASMKSAIRKFTNENPEAAKVARAKAALDEAEATTPPRLGKYLIMSYGAGGNPLHLGYVELVAGGNYRSLTMDGKQTGEGRYEYDGKKVEVRWISGPNVASKWGGKFDITRAGKSHSLRFTQSTSGENSTDTR